MSCHIIVVVVGKRINARVEQSVHCAVIGGFADTDHPHGCRRHIAGAEIYSFPSLIQIPGPCAVDSAETADLNLIHIFPPFNDSVMPAAIAGCLAKFFDTGIGLNHAKQSCGCGIW